MRILTCRLMQGRCASGVSMQGLSHSNAVCMWLQLKIPFPRLGYLSVLSIEMLMLSSPHLPHIALLIQPLLADTATLPPRKSA